MKKLQIITALVMIGIISWFIDVFGRTLTPVHPKGPHGSVTPKSNVMVAWNGQVVRTNRSEDFSLHW